MTDFEKKWEEFCKGEIKFNWSRYGKELVKDFIESERKDLIEKTNKRWRDKLKEYIDKLDKWTPPSQFGSASGSMTKKFIKDDLSDLLEDK